VSAFGIYDDGRVRTASDWGTVGVVKVFAGVQITCVPAVDDQCGGSRPEIGKMLMECVKLMREG
jgi:hypothetical protein